MLDLNSLAVDPDKSLNGTWVEILGAKFKIARLNNRNASNARSLAVAKFYETLSKKKPEDISEKDSEELRKVQARVIADHVLLDWKGVGVSGKEIKFTHAEAYKILSDDKYEDLLQYIVRQAAEHENFAASTKQAVSKDVKTTAAS